VNAVCSYQRVNGDVNSILEASVNAISSLDKPYQPVPFMQTFGRETVDERPQQVSPVRLIMREAKRRLNCFPERSTKQGAAVIPAALMPSQRPYSHLCQLLRQTEPMQNARSIRTDLDPCAHFPQVPSLLVNVHVDARLQ
jgi:hypothetical protein